LIVLNRPDLKALVIGREEAMENKIVEQQSAESRGKNEARRQRRWGKIRPRLSGGKERRRFVHRKMPSSWPDSSLTRPGTTTLSRSPWMAESPTIVKAGRCFRQREIF